jgi:peptide/nickel transport system ATP-binding protein
MTTAAIVQVSNVSVEYETKDSKFLAVNQVSFELSQGQRLGIVGESGSGKSTLGTAICGLTRFPARIVSGSVRIGGNNLLELSASERRLTMLRDVAYVPQAAMNSLNPSMRIQDQFLDALARGVEKKNRAGFRDVIESRLLRVGLDLSLLKRFPHELSGGQKQRIIIAIATILSPKIIVADEPTSALDVIIQRQVLQSLSDVQKVSNAAVVLIGHDIGLLAQFVDTLAIMYAGKIVELGSLESLLKSPQHPYTKRLIASVPTILKHETLVGIPGLPPNLDDLPIGCSFQPRCTERIDKCAVSRPELVKISNRHVACWLHDSGNTDNRFLVDVRNDNSV